VGAGVRLSTLRPLRIVIYVCVPAHNESRTIGVLLWKVRKVLGEFDRPYRVVVHEDGSTDDTAEVLARYSRSLPLTVLRSDEQLGYAASVDRLLRYVVNDAPYPKRDCAVVLQGDFTEDPQDLVGLVKVLEGGADIVAGCATDSSGPVPRSVRLIGRLSRLALGKVLDDSPVSDPLNGFRAYRVIVLKKAFRDRPESEPLVSSEGWAANLELLGALAPHARRIGEAPLDRRYEFRARPSRLRAWRTLRALARLRGGSWWSELDAGAA
jgi:glycosyltransferase involved in cell wall biosynthesis